MQHNIASGGRKISRRTMLGAAAAIAAVPAMAEECRVGPPPHHKGPQVFMDYDQVELDASYDQEVYEPLIGQVVKRLASNSEAVRARIGAPQRVAYGPTEIEKLDVYRTNLAKAPIFVFIHGGNWLVGSAKDSGYPAEMFVNAGAHYVALDFTSVKEAGGDLSVMAAQVRRGIAWVYKNAASFGGDPDRVYIGGLFLRRAPLRRRARHRLAKAVQSPRQHGEGRALHEWNVRDGTGATLVAAHLRELHRSDGGRDEFAAPHRQAIRADNCHLRHLRDARLPAPEPRLCRRG